MIFSKKKKVFLKTGALILIFSAFCFLCVREIKAEAEMKIRINELIPNPSGSDVENEYIELYNFGNKDVDVEGWILADADRENREKIGKTKKIKGIIKSGDFLEIKKSVSLNNDWDVIYFLDPDGKEIDKIKYEDIEDDFSYSFDGNEWKWTPFLTPGEKNEFEKEKEWGKDIIITEFLPNPSGEETEDEFIELYNNENKEVNLNGWILKDNGSEKGYLINTDLIVGSKKYLAIYRNNFDFSLNNSENEVIFLLDSKNTSIDSVEYKGCKEDVSWNFDGKKWRQSKFLTPGEENRLNNLPEIKLKIDKDIYENIYAEFEVEAKDKDKDKLKIVWDFGDGHKSYLEKTRHKYEKEGNYLASVKVSDGSEDALKNFKVAAKKYPHQEVKIVEIMPNPKGLDSEGEWIRVKNNSNKVVDLKGWSVATGATEKTLVNHPVYNSIKIEPGEERKIKREDSYFSLGNKQAYVELRYPDGKVAHSLKYKEKETIGDNSIFQKEKGKKWRWIVDNEQGTMNKEQLSENNEQLTMNNEQQVMNKDQLVADNKTQEIGGDDASSLRITQIPVEIEISLEMYQKLKENAGISEEFGEFSVRQENEKYFFTAKSISSEHYAKKFLEKLLQKINTFLNSLFI